MKKIILTPFAVICAICMAFGILMMMNVNTASANTEGVKPVLSETKVMRSNDNTKMLLATAIKNYSDVYEVGYTGINEGDKVIADNNKYYTSITSGENTWTAADIFGDVYNGAGMIIWQINFSVGTSYSFKPYALVGERDDSSQLVVPAEEVRITPDADIVKQYFTIEIDADGGSGAPASVVVLSGTSASKLYNLSLTKTHYHYNAWEYYDGEAWQTLNSDATVTTNVKVRPKWEIDTYTITFKNYDGTILQSGSVAYGATPEYIGETPTKSEDDVAYEFKDWDSEIMPVTKDATYNAKFYKKLMQKHAANLKSIIENDLAGEYILGEDIDMTGVTFKSIGGYESTDSDKTVKSFTGSFDGKGYAIKNLTITGRSGQDNWGVYVTGSSNFIASNNGTVKNVAFIDLTMANRPNFVGIIGQNNGTVSNVFADITLTGNMTSMAQMNGGIVARIDSGKVENCIVNIAGGLGGNQIFGSVVGRNYCGSANQNAIKNNYSISNGMTLHYEANGRDVLCQSQNSEDIYKTLNCANYDNALDFFVSVKSLSNTDGWDSDVWALQNDELKFGDEIVVDLSGITVLSQENAENFKSIIESNMSGYFMLKEDIDFTGKTFTPIGAWDNGGDNAKPFTGTFDGNGHALKNITLTKSGDVKGGTTADIGKGAIFEYNQGVIKNVAVDYIAPALKNGVGFIGQNNGTVSNVYVKITASTATAWDTQYYGVVVQRNGNGSLTSGCTISNCIGEIVGLSGEHKIGTVVGYNYNTNNGLKSLLGISNGITISYGSTGGKNVMWNTTYDAPARQPDANSKLYESVSALITDGYEFSSANGWAKYWKIENNTLSFNNYVIGSIA